MQQLGVYDTSLSKVLRRTLLCEGEGLKRGRFVMYQFSLLALLVSFATTDAFRPHVRQIQYSVFGSHATGLQMTARTEEINKWIASLGSYYKVTSAAVLGNAVKSTFSTVTLRFLVFT